MRLMYAYIVSRPRACAEACGDDLTRATSLKQAGQHQGSRAWRLLPGVQGQHLADRLCSALQLQLISSGETGNASAKFSRATSRLTLHTAYRRRSPCGFAAGAFLL